MIFFDSLYACGKPILCTVYPLLGVIYQFFSVLTLQTSVACAACTPFGDTRVICTEKANPFVRYWLCYLAYMSKKNHSLDACGNPTVCTVQPLWGVIYQFFSVLTLQTRVACAACTPFGDTGVICTEKVHPFIRYWL